MPKITSKPSSLAANVVGSSVRKIVVVAVEIVSVVLRVHPGSVFAPQAHAHAHDLALSG